MKHKPQSQKSSKNSGFTLTELTISAAIIGALGATAFPHYLNQIETSCQRQTVSVVSQILTQTQAFNDEFGTTAQTWTELDEIATIMTADGPATGGSLNSPITLPPRCSYIVSSSVSEGKYIYTAFPPENYNQNLNIFACINTATGASDIRRGNSSRAATEADLRCP